MIKRYNSDKRGGEEMIERSYKARKIPEKHQYRAVVIDGHKIIKTADKALYTAKQKKNCAVFSSIS